MNFLRQFATVGFRTMSKNTGYYAVANGRQTGIFKSWTECEKQVKGFSKPVYKKFKVLSEAEEFLRNKASSTSATCSRNFPRCEPVSELYKLGTKDCVVVVSTLYNNLKQLVTTC